MIFYNRLIIHDICLHMCSLYMIFVAVSRKPESFSCRVIRPLYWLQYSWQLPCLVHSLHCVLFVWYLRNVSIQPACAHVPLVSFVHNIYENIHRTCLHSSLVSFFHGICGSIQQTLGWWMKDFVSECDDSLNVVRFHRVYCCL